MRINASFLLVSILLSSSASASWFSSTKEYSSWDKSQLRTWLDNHNIQVPSGYDREQLQALVKSNWDAKTAWTLDQYQAAQKQFEGVKDDSFATWDESRLRQFLLDRGVVAPSGPKESMIVAAKQQYASYTSAMSSLSAQASTAVYGNAASQASKSITSLASTASASAYSGASVASASASSAAAWASATADRKLRDAQDYVYSTWDENQLRSYLEEKGVIKPKTQATRDQLLAKMKGVYADATSPVWNAWGDSYIHEWLVSHGIIKSDYEKNRDALTALMNSYYYSTTDTVYSTWDDSTLKSWLVEHDIIKSDAQVKREKMQKLVADNYASARDTVWGGWTDSEVKNWLVEHGYMRSDAEVKRDELLKTMHQKYHEAALKGASYTTWPDARLRAFLRTNGLPESSLPSSRPSLLHEVRIRWIQSNNRVESMLQAIRDAMTNSVETAEAKLAGVLEMLTGVTKDDAYKSAEKGYNSVKSAASSLSTEASSSISSASSVAGKSASSLSSVAGKSASSASSRGAKSASSASSVASSVASSKMSKASVASSKYSKVASSASSSSSSSVSKAYQSAKNEL